MCIRDSYNNEDKKLTVRLATGAAIYAIGMALTVFAKVPLPVELAFLIVSYAVSYTHLDVYKRQGFDNPDPAVQEE